MLNKLLKAVGLFLLVFFVMGILVYKIGEASEGTVNFPWRIYAKLHKTRVDFSHYKPFEDQAGAWYNTNLIAHACGGIDGEAYTNSCEALEQAIKNHFDVVEVDFSLTSDEYVVLNHEWDDYIPTYDEYMNTKILDRYSPMDVAILFDYMKHNEALFIITDIKGNDEYKISIFEKIVNYAEANDMIDCLDRLVIQIYWQKDFETFHKIYPFSNWIYTLYISGNRDFDGIAQFCLEHNIRAVTMGTGWGNVLDHELIFGKMNIKIFTFTVDDEEIMIEEQQKGVDGWYTNFVKPDDLKRLGF